MHVPAFTVPAELLFVDTIFLQLIQNQLNVDVGVGVVGSSAWSFSIWAPVFCTKPHYWGTEDLWAASSHVIWIVSLTSLQLMYRTLWRTAVAQLPSPSPSVRYISGITDCPANFISFHEKNLSTICCTWQNKTTSFPSNYFKEESEDYLCRTKSENPFSVQIHSSLSGTLTIAQRRMGQVGAAEMLGFICKWLSLLPSIKTP